jgi:phosphate transport system permease protein
VSNILLFLVSHRSVANGARVCAAITSALVLAIGVLILSDALPALRELGLQRFLSDGSWHPTEGTFGVRAMLVGSLTVTIGAAAVATPFALLSALFNRVYAHRSIAAVNRALGELLAGIPSIVYGFWGLMVLVPIVARLRAPGTSLLAGVLVLAIMIFPTVATVADSALGNVPVEYCRAAASLGLGRWQVVRHVMLPVAGPAISSGILLGTSRALGETMAVLMVCGNIGQIPSGLLAPVRTLTANIALEMPYAMGLHRSSLFVCGLFLLAVMGAIALCLEVLHRGPRSS